MARPIKNSCDYFTHDRDMRNHKKVRAIRSKFGNVGYSIWVMTLEYLTGNDGNVIQNSEMEYELMAGDFGVSVTEISNVINFCIRLELLFLNDGFINSESLDERLAPVYLKRNKAKSLSKQQLRNNGKYVSSNTDGSVVSVTETPQSKVKEIKVKENKELLKIGGTKKVPLPPNPEFVNCKNFWLDEFKQGWTFSGSKGKSLKSIISKIKTVVKKAGNEINETTVIDTFKTICLKLPDYYKNKDLEVLDQKFNEIIIEIKNKSNGITGTKQPSVSKYFDM